VVWIIFFIFPIFVGMMIQSDELHHFSGGRVETTNQNLFIVFLPFLTGDANPFAFLFWDPNSNSGPWAPLGRWETIGQECCVLGQQVQGEARC
jgi:hypothetical protein